MKRSKRTFTPDEKELIFNLWKQGTGFSDIGKILDAAPGTVFTALRESGGIKPEPRTIWLMSGPNISTSIFYSRESAEQSAIAYNAIVTEYKEVVQ